MMPLKLNVRPVTGVYIYIYNIFDKFIENLGKGFKAKNTRYFIFNAFEMSRTYEDRE